MSAELIWATLHSVTVILIAVSILAGGFYLLGRSILNLLRLPTLEASSINIAVGLASATFFGWYAYRLDVSLVLFVEILYFIIIVLFILFIFNCKNYRSVLNSHAIYTLPCFSIVFSLQAMIAFGGTALPFGTLGNNDIYDWSILAEHLLDEPGYDNVYTGDGRSAQQNRIDSFGTFFIIAICAKLIGTSALEASTFFTIFILSLTGLSIYDLIKKLFLFNNVISFGIVLLTTAGTFFFYIAYHNFYGQLIAIFFYIITLCTLFHGLSLHGTNEQISFVKLVALSAFSLAGILLVYQSGFFIFLIFSIALCIIYPIIYNFQRYGHPSVLCSMKILLFPLLCGLSITAIFLPELAIHTVYRTMDVKSALNGWPLPLINPAYLFSVPLLQPFPISSGALYQYLFGLMGMIFIFIFAYQTTKKHNNEIATNFLVLAMFFSMAVGAYIFAYYLKGGIYQVWKLASFVVLPLSFVIYVGCALILQQVTMLGGMIRKTLTPLVMFGAVFVVVITPIKLTMTPVSKNIEEMKHVRSLLLDQGIENVVLDFMPFNEAYMAFNVLSGSLKVFPLVQTYVAPVDLSVIQQLDHKKTRILVSSKCNKDNSEQVGGESYSIIPLQKLFIDNSIKYLFGLGYNFCAKLSVQLMDGFSGREPWGVWSEGNKLRMQINIPPNFEGKDLLLSFDVHPFGASQTTSITVGGRSTNRIIDKSMDLVINIPSKLTRQKKLSLDFYIDNPISPNTINSTWTDTRKLGIGFKSLSMQVVD